MTLSPMSLSPIRSTRLVSSRRSLATVAGVLALTGLATTSAVAALDGQSTTPASSAAAQTDSLTASATLTEATTLDELVASSDYRDEYGDILRLYRAFFGREADVAGARYWIDDYRSGRSIEEIARDFSSPDQLEFVSAYDDIAADDHAQYLERVYTNMLDRAADRDGLTYWLGLMDDGTLDRGSVVRWVAANDEFIARYPYAATSTSPVGCEAIAEAFVAGPSVNPDLADPISSATCVGDDVVITSNGIPDYTYVGTSPGDPEAQSYEFTIPASPTDAATATAVPLLGTAAVALNGVPIYGPTEGTGGDVLSLTGALSECGSHNGPTGFHIHLFGTSTVTDCIFTAEEAASSPQLLGYALDGYPIYTGNDQYDSSWELTDESLFATDTWAAHAYVEGSGDLDRCNGLTDENGDYAYYTTDTFPYVIGCYTGVVDLDEALGGGAGGAGPGGRIEIGAP